MTMVRSKLGSIFVDDRGERGRPTALLWPSLFTDHEMWAAQVPTLLSAGWRTLALDPPAHGRSDGPDRSFTMDECADVALAVLDAAAVTEPIVVFGTSWGGFVAPRVALRAPGRVRGLVLFATSADGPMLSQRIKATALTSLFRFRAADGYVDRINLSHLLSADTLRARPELGADLARAYRTWDRRRLLVAIRSVLLERTSIIKALHDIAVPALVVSGADDGLLPPRLGRRIAQRIPQARFVEVPNAAHLIPLERPDTVNELIVDFVGRLRSEGESAG